MPARLSRFALLTAAAAALLVTGSDRATAQAEFELTLHHFLGPAAPAHTKMLEPWTQRIEEASGGRVAIEIFPAMALGGRPPELIRQVRDGVVDLVWTVNGYTAGLFPRSEVFELPFIHTNDAVATNLAMRALFDEHLAEEYEGLKVLFTHVHAGQAIQMVDRPVHGPEDLAGTTLRIPTRTGAWVIEALDANAVGMPVPELPQALSRKVVDGALIPWEIIPPLALQDLTAFQIEGHDRIRFGTTTFQVSMNLDRWNSLPEDLQRIFLEQSDEDWLAEVGRVWTEQDEVGIGIAVAAGNEHITLTPEQTEAFREKLEPVVDRWIEEVSAQGIDGAALVEAARAAVTEHSRAD